MSKPVATRASTRTKATPEPAPTTRVTRARAAPAAAAAKPAPTPKPAAVKKTATKKQVDATNVPAKPASKTGTSKGARRMTDSEREPISAYLRIRPYLGEGEHPSMPYLSSNTDTSVTMTDPNHEAHATQSRFRPSTVPPTSVYTFSHVFPGTTTQSSFFTKTTLPLVRDVLQGQNALLFTYGVTNSGKTFTVHGGSSEGTAGILPRTLDVIFNSIDGLHSDGKYRPVRLQGIELADPGDDLPLPDARLAHVLGEAIETPPIIDTGIDPTVLKLDRNYEYSIWLSYSEVYNEKVYDLLASVKDSESTSKDVNTHGVVRQALPLKTSPKSDNDEAQPGRYIAGLRQFRVTSALQAKKLVNLGQFNRRVFGTFANSESSRSHGMVVLKVVRGHRGERNDPEALQISRLTLVDLAGSERTKHAHTTGERLREAGNINKSLMVLGQCMETMRSNQRRLAASLASHDDKDGRMDTRDVRKALAVVPFRHSKLTEALMDYFIGDGRAVMIVNVNPYDTGFDENSHVMKFAALAREVYITPAPAPLQRVPTMTGPGKTQGKTIRKLGPLTLKDPDIAPALYRRKVTITTADKKGRKSEVIVEVQEEEEEEVTLGEIDHAEDDDDDDAPLNPMIDALFDEIENLRLQLFESETRNAIIAAETREAVMRENEAHILSLERRHAKRLMEEVERGEAKMNAKIDMLHRSGLLRQKPIRVRSTSSPDRELDSEEEEQQDVEMSVAVTEEDEDDSEQDECGESESGDSNRSPSPLAGKHKERPEDKLKKRVTRDSMGQRQVRYSVPDGPELSRLPDEEEDDNSEDNTDETESDLDHDEQEDEEEDDDESDGNEDEEEEEDWLPQPESPKGGSKSRVSRLARDLGDLSVNSSAPSGSESGSIAPNKTRGKSRKSQK